MRIGIDAHYVGVRDGGNERYCENLLRHLAATAAPGDTYYVFSYRGAAAARLGNGTLTHLPLASRSVSWQRAVELPRYARRLSLDVLHVPFNYLPVGRARKIVTIYDLAFLDHPETHGFIERARLGLLTGYAARRTHQVITISEASRRAIVDRFGVAESRVTLAPPAVDRAVFRPASEEARAAIKGHLGVTAPYLLHVGTLHPRKNVPVLIDALARLRARGAAVHLVLVGRRERGAAAVARRVAAHGLEDVVHHVARLPDELLAAAYSAAEALVVPSLYEGFGMPALEAMSCGCPVISSRAGALPETCGDAALFFDARSVDHLAAQLDRVLRGADLRHELVSRGFANCARFTWERTAELVSAAYRP